MSSKRFAPGDDGDGDLANSWLEAQPPRRAATLVLLALLQMVAVVLMIKGTTFKAFFGISRQRD